MSEIRIERAAKKDLKRIGPDPERTHIAAGLRRLAEDAANLDVKPITAAPGWFRLHISDYRACCYRAQQEPIPQARFGDTEVLRQLSDRLGPLTGQRNGTTTELGRVSSQHGMILPGGRGHLRSGVRATGEAQLS